MSSTTKARQSKKVAIVTGSSSGIGQGLAVELARLGYAVTVQGRNTERLQKTREMCLKAGCSKDEILSVVGDVSEDQVLKNIADETYSKFGRIDVLINNAGIAIADDMSTAKLEIAALDKIFETNLRAPLILSRHVTPALKETKGCIVNVSSASVNNHKLLIYGALKAALEQASATTALELATDGVRVNCVRLGAMWTPLFAQFAPSQEVADFIKMELTNYIHPIRRQMSQDDVNNAVRFLLSEDSSFMTGVVLPVAGGAHLPFEGNALMYQEQLKQLQKKA